MAHPSDTTSTSIERVQTGVRLEKRLLKVLKGLAEYKELSLGDLLEGIVLHAFEGKNPFSPDTIAVIDRLKEVYRLDLTAEASHRLTEDAPPAQQSNTPPARGA
jgi:predicted DNA-binding ribbon-helix-helix protein